MRAAMQAERERLQASGWVVDDIPRNCAFFFCDRLNERVCVSIETAATGAVVLCMTASRAAGR